MKSSENTLSHLNNESKGLSSNSKSSRNNIEINKKAPIKMTFMKTVRK